MYLQDKYDVERIRSWVQSLFGCSPYLGAVLIWAQALRPYELILNINAVHLSPSL
jgi:hypothetical protein